MGKLDYLDALKRAMHGLPPEIQAKTLAWYEQRFVDGVAAGRSEQSIAAELDDPRRIAVTLRASTHMEAFKEKKNPANAARMLVAGVGLLVFNLFMAIPAAVYASLLVAVYGTALGFYVSGIAITASGLAGANELVLNNPLHRIVIMADGERHETIDHSRTRVAIGKQGIHVYEDEAADGDRADERADDAAKASVVIRRAEKVADAGIRITTDMDGESRTTQTLVGFAMVLGGILLFLLSLVITRYTFIGLKRYVKMNLSLLRGA
ncbi:HAAS signaling domain-containing protein [Massilia sp.]|uniref:HAAS signaling domain-containing protein n=1 Tax=Massilia sp. TaxID=1882437 RepID=UPI00391DA7A6